MAAPTLSPDSGWTQVRREVKPGKFSPHIRFRSRGDVFLSSDFVKMANIADCSRVAVYLSSDGYRVGFRFHSDDEADSFVVRTDGGSNRDGKYNGRVLSAKLANRSPVVAALIRNGGTETRYLPRKDVHGLWCIDLVPCFESKLENAQELEPSASGIYRYRLGETTVYIGRGVIRDRIADPLRKGWEFDCIEYSVLNNPEAEAKWESHWLSEHQAKHSRWPTYNRIGGVRPTE